MRLSFVGKVKSKKDHSIVLLRGNVEGKPMFYYVALRQDKAIALYDAQKKGGTFDMGNAVLLKQGEGLEPPRELQQEIYDTYGIKPMSEEEVREQLGDLLAPEGEE